MPTDANDDEVVAGTFNDFAAAAAGFLLNTMGSQSWCCCGFDMFASWFDWLFDCIDYFIIHV